MTVSKATAQQMVLDCTGGKGCPMTTNSFDGGVAGIDANGCTTPPTMCGKAGTYQVCIVGYPANNGVYYLAADGTHFMCASQSDCTQAAIALNSWCTSH
jgi:hypothetical protein